MAVQQISVRIPPHSADAEESVLGALLVDRDAIIAVAEFLAPSDFYDERHRSIFEACLSLYEERTPIDVLTVADRLKKQKVLKEIEDIRRSKIIKELQRKIAQGEEVHLENYPELTPEERQVLAAQAEAVKQQKALSVQRSASLVEPRSKTPRGSWLFGGKAQAEKQKTHVEKPLPPSG